MSVQTTSSLKPPLGNNNYKFSVFLKRCTSIVHPHMYFVVQVEMQTCFVKIHTKWQISFARVLEDKFLGILSGHAQAHEIWHFLMKFSRMSFVSAFAIKYIYIYTMNVRRFKILVTYYKYVFLWSFRVSKRWFAPNIFSFCFSTFCIHNSICMHIICLKKQITDFLLY